MEIAIYGQDRQAGAIGVMENWSLFFECEAVSDAIKLAQKARYEANREHVLPQSFSINGGARRPITLEELPA